MEDGSPMGKQPLIIAHRGFSARYPENTLAAVRAAMRLGVDMVEVDVQETHDAELIVFHDYRLDRVCGVRGRVRDTTFAEMRRLNRAVPTLAEVLRACRGKTRVLIEIKRADPRKVTALVREFGMERNVIVFSLSIPRLKALAQSNPRITRFGLIARNLDASLRRWHRLLEVQGVGVSRRLVRSRTVVERIHRRGWKLFVWTVNRRAEMAWLAAWGVDGIITNHPDRAKSCLARR